MPENPKGNIIIKGISFVSDSDNPTVCGKVMF